MIVEERDRKLLNIILTVIMIVGLILATALAAFAQESGSSGIDFKVSKEKVVYPESYSITAYEDKIPVSSEKVTWFILDKEKKKILEKSGVNPLELPYSTPFEWGWYCQIEGYEEPFYVDDMIYCKKSFPEDSMAVVFNNTPILAGGTYDIGGGSVSLSEDGHTLSLNNINLSPEDFTSDWLLKNALYVESDKEDCTFNIEINGDCNIAYSKTPERDIGSMLLAFAQNSTVNIKGVSQDAALRGNNMNFVQYEPDPEEAKEKINTFNFNNLDIFSRSNENAAFSVSGDYINFTDSTIDCCALKSISVFLLNDINYAFRDAPSTVVFDNCKLQIENAYNDRNPEIWGDGTLSIAACFSSHDQVSLKNCDTDITVDHMLGGETRAMTLFDAELTVEGGKLSAAVYKDPDFVDDGILAAAIQVPTFKAVNGADVNLICETDIKEGGISTGITYAKNILIQDSKIHAKVTGQRAHGLYYFYREYESSQNENASQWQYKKGTENTDVLYNKERGVDIINSTAEILTKGASEGYLVNAVSGKRIYIGNSLIKLQSISTDKGLALPVLAYNRNENCGIILSGELPIIPKNIKIANEYLEEVEIKSSYLTDGYGNAATEVVLKPEGEPTPAVPVELVKASTSGSKGVRLSWNKVPGATKYVVYGQKCGKKYKKLITTSKTLYKVKKINGKKLKAHKTYKFYVAAYKGSKKLVSSNSIHFITGNRSGKYANVKSIKAKAGAVTLNSGAKKKIDATYKMYYGKKHIKKSHGAALRYISDCPAVATVSSSGVVTAKAAGTAIIYIQDIGGKHCKTTVTVK